MRVACVAMCVTVSMRLVVLTVNCMNMIVAVPRFAHARYCTRARLGAAPFLTVIGHFDTPTARSN